MNEPQFNQYIVPINLDAIEFWQWTAEDEEKPSQLHVMLSASPAHVTFVLRFKGPGTLDEIIWQLQQHRREIWGKEKRP